MQVPAQGAFTAKAGWEGIAASADARAPRDVRGQTLAVRFEISDLRPPLPPAVPGGNDSRGPYQVAVMLQVRLCSFWLTHARGMLLPALPRSKGLP